MDPGGERHLLIEQYGEDLLRSGRKEEIGQLIHILCKDTEQNNAILLGESEDVRKVINKLAQRIASKKVPDVLKGVRFFELDLSALLSVPAEIAGILQEIRSFKGNIILYLGQMHLPTIMEFFSSLMYERLVRLVVTTTVEDYSYLLTHYPSIESRFQAHSIFPEMKVKQLWARFEGQPIQKTFNRAIHAFPKLKRS